MAIERRNAPRVQASLEIQVVGTEPRPQVRHSDLSVTGVRVTDLDVDIPLGGLVALRISSRDREQNVELNTRVVRSEDGVTAFEFLPESESEREALAMLFVHVAREQVRHTALVLAADRRVDRITIETDWQLGRGERVTVEVPSPEGGVIRLEGRAVRSRPMGTASYSTRIEITSEATVTAVERPTVRARADRSRHLPSAIAQVRVPNLLSLSLRA